MVFGDLEANFLWLYGQMPFLMLTHQLLLATSYVGCKWRMPLSSEMELYGESCIVY